MRSGAVAALSVSGVLEIHKAWLYPHPAGALLWGSFLLRALGPKLVSARDTSGPQELSKTGLQVALPVLRPEVFLPSGPE